jgi:hypothetical protein
MVKEKDASCCNSILAAFVLGALKKMKSNN